MSVGKVDVWVPSAFNGYCKVDNTYRFVATVQNCDGSIVEWSGGKFQTNDGKWNQIKGDPHGDKPGVPGYYDGVPGTGDPGHITFELPPGCYLVTASVHIWITVPKVREKLLLGNLATHKAIIKVECGKETCVSLFQPTGWHCGIIMSLQLLMTTMKEKRLITAAEHAAAEKAIMPILEKLEKSAFDKKEEEVVKTIMNRLIRSKDEK
jgi:hypothetical protein